MKGLSAHRAVYFVRALASFKKHFANPSWLILLAVLTLFAGQEARAGATMTVNSNGDNATCDDVLTLREAILLGRSELFRSLTQAERNQIGGGATFVVVPPSPGCPGATGYSSSGGFGSSFADDIFFSNDVSTIPLSSEIEIGANDDLNGLKPNGGKITLSGEFAPASANGLNLYSLGRSGSQIRNLIIRNFGGNGIFGFRDVNGAIFEGLEIFNNGGNGIWLSSADFGSFGVNPRNNRIGGVEPQQRNYIYSNGLSGIAITTTTNFDRSGNMNNVIENNYIGLNNDSANVDVGNNGQGIYLENAFGNLIGGDTTASRNIISGNFDGIQMRGGGTYGNRIINNIIGRGSNFPVIGFGNRASGVSLAGGVGQFPAGSLPNQIGESGRGNVISGNAGHGIWMSDGGTSKNVVQGNFIGTNTGANEDVGNALDGIAFVNGASENQIGGAVSGQGNVIAFNRNGINADSGVRNQFRRNRIFGNDALGIDLAPAGVTQNDTGDLDAGANDLQNFPVITYLLATSSSINLQGTFNSKPNQTYDLEFFGNTSVDGSGYGEGRVFLGTTSVGTNGSGNAAFNLNFAVSLSSVGQWVTATATDASGNTSEFSLARYICADLQLSPPGILAFSQGGPTSFSVTTSTGCSYTPQSTVPWIMVGSTGGGTINISIFPNVGSARNGAVQVHYNNGVFFTFASFNVSQQGGARRTRFDFEGDGKTDISVFRPAAGEWWYVRSSDNQNRALQFGNSADKIAPADFTGDGLTDIAFWRPSTGFWFILRSEDGSFFSFPFGTAGDIPAPADYDGDGKADPAVFRPASATWFISKSTGGTSIVQFGASGDVPVAGDYDGDGRADIAVFRPSGGSWWILSTLR